MGVAFRIGTLRIHLNLLLFECRESDEDSFRFHCFEFVEIDVADSLVPYSSISELAFVLFANMADFISCESRLNIRPSLLPRAMIRPSFSMKHPS